MITFNDYLFAFKDEIPRTISIKIKINHTYISIHVQKNKISYAGIQINDIFKYCSTEPNYRLFPVFSAVLPVWAWLSICDVISYKSDKVRPLDNERPFVS